MKAEKTTFNQQINLGLADVTIGIHYRLGEVEKPVVINVSKTTNQDQDGADISMKTNIGELRSEFIDYAIGVLLDFRNKYYQSKDQEHGLQKEEKEVL